MRSATRWSPNCSRIGYSLQGTPRRRKARAPGSRPGSSATSPESVSRFQRLRQPAISGRYEEEGTVGNSRTRAGPAPPGTPDRVRVHDFVSRRREGDPTRLRSPPQRRWVSLGIDHDTASFAVNAIRPMAGSAWATGLSKARSLVITADAAGAMARGFGSGSGSCNSSRIARVSRSPLSLPAGTSSGTDRHRLFIPHRRTAGQNRW